ncbi:unnamed protein product [Rodentolepis nana]|uniref:Secreted protein n=1 Tax=Rodentolepis nana TaxID=102285 RepID=A0A0R3TAQ6_RODNA|nr:unnamed protein product [Rodentolepis nana]
MRALYSLLVLLAFATLSSAYTFQLKKEGDAESGEEYVMYNDQKYDLSDEPGKSSLTFLEDDCVVYLDLSKTEPSPFREGNAICKNMFPSSTHQTWEEYVEERLSEVK